MKPTEEEIRKLVSHQIDVLELMKYGINREVAMGYVAEVSRLIQSISIVAINETLATEAEELPKVMASPEAEATVEPDPRVDEVNRALAPVTKAQLIVNLWNEGNKDVLWLAKKLRTTDGYVKRKLKQAGIDYSAGVPPRKSGSNKAGGASIYTDEERLEYVIHIEEQVRKGVPKFRALADSNISSGCYNRWKHWVLSGRLDCTKEQYAYLQGEDWVESRKKSGWTKNSPEPKKKQSLQTGLRWKRWPVEAREAIMKEWTKKRKAGASIKEMEAYFTEKYGRPVVSGTVYAWFSKFRTERSERIGFKVREKKVMKEAGLSDAEIAQQVEVVKEKDEPTPVEPEPVVTKPKVVETPPNSVLQSEGTVEISVLGKETVSAMHTKVLLANALFLRAKKEKGQTWREDTIASVATVKKAIDAYDKQLENEGYYVLAHRPDGMKALKQLKNNTKVAKEIYRAMTDTGNK